MAALAHPRPAHTPRIALGGIAAGEDLGKLAWCLESLHPRNKTFPGEVLVELAADAVEDADASA